MNLSGCEDVWIEVTLSDNFTLIVETVYGHPQPKYDEFSHAFNKNLIKLRAKKDLLSVEISTSTTVVITQKQLLRSLLIGLLVLAANN